MKIFVLFTPSFHRWPLALAGALERRLGGGTRVFGLATGSATVVQRVRAHESPPIDPLDHLDPLERQWLARPLDRARLAAHEARLGPGALRRLVIADRQIGVGFVSGARLPRTRLQELTNDPDAIRRYAVGLLDYVFGVLEKERPDLVFCYTVAGAVALALAEASRSLGIPFAQLVHTRVGHRHVIDDSISGMLAPVQREFEAALGDGSRLRGRLPEARALLEDFRKRPERPGYTTWALEKRDEALALGNLGRRALAELRTSAKDGFRERSKYLRVLTPLRRGWHDLGTALRARRLQRRGPFAAPEARPDTPFAYFPLHVDPEQATMVLAPMHTDQLAVVEALAKSLPLGTNLVVKEHFPMLGLRPAGFYERLAALPGVFLASPFAESAALVREAALTSVITGTAGWEALLLGRPVLLLGDAPYRALGEGVVHAPDLSRLPEAVEAALDLSPASDERLSLWIAALLERSFELPTELLWGAPTPETVAAHPEIAERLTQALLEVPGV